MAKRVSLHRLYGTPTKWPARSSDQLHGHLNSGAGDFIHRRDCRGDISFLIIWKEGQSDVQKIYISAEQCLKNALSYSCSPYYHYPQTTRRNSAFRVIDGAAAPLGRRLIAEWIKFEFIQQKKDFIHRVRNTGQLIDLFY